MSVTFTPRNAFASAGRTAAPQLPLVFLPGWGFDGRILESAARVPHCFAPAGFIDPVDLIEDLAAFLDGAGLEKIRLAGWSMGAHLALAFAGAHPHRVDSLFLFSMRKAWPTEEIAAIRRDLDADPASFMRSFYRKCFMGDRAGYARFAEDLQERYLREMDLPLLHRGLEYLEHSQPVTGGGVKDLHLFHGRRDIIAPVAEMADLPGAAVEIFEKEGHALFLGPEFVWPECGLAARKETIRQRFSRAAATYDAHADVQKEVARELAARLPAARLPAAAPASILEIGCGSGNYTALLAGRFPDAEILALDFASGMVAAARRRLGESPRLALLCRDGEEFLATSSRRFDLVTSNATLQWFDDPLAALAQMAGALHASGMLLCSLFGPETLGELGRGISAVCGHGAHLPPHRFPSLADLHTALAGALPEFSCTEQLVQRRYGSLRELLLHIRKTGTSGWRSASRPLLTKERLRDLEDWFMAEYGGFQVTYQAYLVQGRRQGDGNG